MVVKPLVELLVSKGWDLDQILFGTNEWKVPKTPSEASKREARHSFDYYPVDIAVFDEVKNCGDYRHILFIIECKQPSKEEGIQQLETYLGLEPHVKLGIWCNTADVDSFSAFVYKTSAGLEPPRSNIVKNIPSVGQLIAPEYKNLRFDDLVKPSNTSLKKLFEELLDVVVAVDNNVTRGEEQLDQLCNLLLLKLNSDKIGSIDRQSELKFRPFHSEKETAKQIKKQFVEFYNLYPDIFTNVSDKEVRFEDATIASCVEKLYRLDLLEVGPESVSTAFQVLRRAALKQEEGQYFTPKPVIQAAVRFMNIGLDDIIIDPACGTGGFLIQSLIDMKERYPNNPKEISKWSQLHLYGIDKDSIGVKLTKAIMQVLDDGSTNCVKGDSVLTHTWPDKFPHLVSNNYENGRFTKVFTNPPFGADLKIKYSDIKRSGLSITSVLPKETDVEIGLAMFNRCCDLLKTGGKLCIVLPETYFFSPSYSFVRKWIYGRLKPKMVINIPIEAFQSFCRAKTNLYIFEKIESEDDYSDDDTVIFSNPQTCGLYKNGQERYVVDEKGNRTTNVDNEMDIVSSAYRNNTTSTVPLIEVKLSEVIEKDVLVPQYYDSRFTKPYYELVEGMKLQSITIGDLISEGIITLRGGHGSPGNDQRKGDIPYIKVSDIRNLRINVNPTNMIPKELAAKYWKTSDGKSDLKPWSLISPNRASSNIGEFAIMLPGEESVVLTKEMYVINVNDNNLGITPFYLLWAFSLQVVRNQWRRITLMQTNREDVGDRYKEIEIPLPPSIGWSEEVSKPFADYFTSLAKSKEAFVNDLKNDSFDYIGNVSPR